MPLEGALGLETTDAQVTFKIKGKILEGQTVLPTNSYSLQEKLLSYGHY